MNRPALDYVKLFRGLPASFLVLDPLLVIHDASEEYLRATLTQREALLGRSIFEAFPDNPEEAGADGTRNLRASLRRVLETGQQDAMAVQKYDVPRTGPGETGFALRYWSPVNTPLLDDQGNVEWIVHRVEDITEFMTSSLAASEGDSRAAGEIVQRSRQMQNTNEKLRRADQAKTTFLTHMSHEIRTPLTTILGLARLALGANPPAHAMEQIEQAGTLLLHLVDQILDLSKIESGVLELECSPFSLAEELERVRLLFVERAAARGLTLVFPQGELPWVRGDALRLGQVITNLVANAIKFTAHGEVRVEASAEEREGRVALSLAVSDTGVGMSPAQMEHLFEAFAQGDTSTQRRYGGTGLGLHISRLLVEAMGGRLEVSSSPGSGTRFSFCLEWERVSPVPAPVPELLDLRGHRILVVEDNDINRDILTALLEDMGAEVATAADGEMALDLLSSRPPEAFSAVLMDVQMPGMDGYEATRRLKRDERFHDLPVIALSAHALLEERQHSLAAGMVDHLTKPVDFDALLASVRRWGRR